MSFPRYPKYKPSGVEWLGDVPEHWEVRRLKSVCRFYGGGTPARDNPSYWNGEIPWVSPKDMKVEALEATEETITEEGMAASAATLLEAGHALLVVRSGILQHTIPVAINRVPLAINQDIRALRFNLELCDAKYFVRWVQGLNDSILPVWAKQGATVESIEHELLANSPICTPPVAERVAIAAFLDRETAKIDGLVAEQQRLIELLKEKRQAVISHAVTKGLDPKAPMKPSGVEWLGDVPAHWEVRRLEHISEFVWGKAHEQFVDDAGQHICVTARFVSTNGEATKYCTANLTPAQRGDILMVMSDLPNGRALARAFLVMDDRSYAINQRVCAVRLLQGDPAYFAMQLDRNRRLLAEDDGANQTHLSNHDFTKLKVLFPPPAEQERIGAAIGALRTRFDALAAEAESAITLLQERRSALISAAVTGQIDVRNVVATEVA